MNQKSDYHPDVIHCPEGNLRFRLLAGAKKGLLKGSTSLMKYSNIVPGIFLSRDNRFIAKCEVNGVTEMYMLRIPEGAGNC